MKELKKLITGKTEEIRQEIKKYFNTNGFNAKGEPEIKMMDIKKYAEVLKMLDYIDNEIRCL